MLHVLSLLFSVCSLNFCIYQLLLLKLPKYGHDALNIRPPKLTDILEYTFCRVPVRKMDNKTIISAQSCGIFPDFRQIGLWAVNNYQAIFHVISQDNC